MDGEAAAQIFDCSGLLCGRILWLLTPRNPQGRLKPDTNNPDPALRQRRLCGLTILCALRRAGPGRWGGDWFYKQIALGCEFDDEQSHREANAGGAN